MNRSRTHYTPSELRAVKQAVNLYKKECPDYAKFLRDRRRKNYYRPLAEQMERSEGALKIVFSSILGNGTYSRSGRLIREAFGAKTRTARQTAASSAAGKSRWQQMKARMKAFCLNDIQVEGVISGKWARLSK